MTDKLTMADALERAARSDSWQNVVTGLGTSNDVLTYHQMYAETWLTTDELSALYYGDAFARRIVCELVKASLRPGWRLTAPSEIDADTRQTQERAILDALAATDAQAAYQEARYWGRLYGRGALMIGVDDGVSDLREPLDVERVRGLLYLEALSVDEFFATSEFYDDPSEPQYGEPSIWRIQRAGSTSGAQAFEIHDSRLLLTGGELTARRKRLENSWRDASVLQSCYAALRSFNSGVAGASHMMTDSSQAVLKIKQFTEMLATEDLSVFTNRMRILEFARSLHIMPVDADREDFSYVERSFAGVPDLLDRMAQVLAGAAGMPVTVLMGQSPAGMNATGESDISQWDDQARAEQEQTDEPNLTRLVQLAAWATEATEPDSWGVEFAALRQMSEVETATYRKAIADTDALYISAGVLTEDEVAIHRFGGDSYDDSPVMVQTEGRQALAEMDIVRATEGTGAMVETQPEAVAVEVDPTAALNGAQMDKMLAIVQAVSLREIPRAAGVAMLETSLPISSDDAERVMGSVGATFFAVEEDEGNDGSPTE